jgi:hypothetical protein
MGQLGWALGRSVRLVAIVFAALPACGSIATQTSAAPADATTPIVPVCVPGMAVGCACVDGAMGAQSCNARGTYDPCVCAVPAPDAGVDAGGRVDTGRSQGEDVTSPLPACTPRGGGGSPTVADLVVDEISLQCARMSDGTLRCAGFDNAMGQFGNGSWGELSRMQGQVSGLCDVEQVAIGGGGWVVCTRHTDGAVRCWGDNHYGALGTGHAGDSHCYDGEACRTVPTLVPGLTDVVDIAVDEITTCAVRRDGSLWCWGDTLGLGGSEEAPTPELIPTITNVARVWSVELGWLFRLRSGEYIARGFGAGYAVPRDAEVDNVSSGANHVCYRLPDATIRCVGQNPDGKLGDGTSADDRTSVSAPVDPGLTGVRQVSVGSYNTCAAMMDGTVQCWGDGQDGALGFHAPDDCVGILGSVPCATHPGRVNGLDSVERVFTGVWGSCALRTDQSVWCWGTLSPMRDSPTPMPVTW